MTIKLHELSLLGGPLHVLGAKLGWLKVKQVLFG